MMHAAGPSVPIGSSSSLRFALVAALLGVASMRLILVFTLEINWDEFLNLSMLYDYRLGELREILQTGFVHLLHWVPLVSENEVDQVVAARVLYLGFALLTSFAIYKITRRLTSFEAALFAVFAYWAFSDTLRHGVSLRTDPLAAACMTSALWCCLCALRRVPRTLLPGMLVGLGGFFTIKAVFILPAVVALTVVRESRDRSYAHGAVTVLWIGVAAVLTFGTLSIAHASTLGEFDSPLSFVERTAGATLASADRSVLLQYGMFAILQNFVLVVFVLAGAFGMFGRGTDRDGEPVGLYALVLLTPLLCLFFYRDSYPYFYPLLLAPVMVVAGLGFTVVSRQVRAPMMIAMLSVVLLSAAFTFARSLQKPLSDQRLTLEVIHDRFSPRTDYIDARSMVASMKKHGPFMSTWGMTDYRDRGRPFVLDAIEAHAPQFVLVNHERLDVWTADDDYFERERLALLPEDRKALANNYRPFWGPLYLPGKTILPTDDFIDILLPGRYRASADADLTINGRRVSPDDRVDLAKGRHAVSTRIALDLVLDVPLPSDNPPRQPLFSGF